MCHYSNVTMDMMVSQITGVTIVILLSVQVQITENIKALHLWPLWGEFTSVMGEFPTQRDSNVENISIWWHHHVYFLGCSARRASHIEGIALPKGPYLLCVSMAGRALLAGYHRHVHAISVNKFNGNCLQYIKHAVFFLLLSHYVLLNGG